MMTADSRNFHPFPYHQYGQHTAHIYQQALQAPSHLRPYVHPIEIPDQFQQSFSPSVAGIHANPIPPSPMTNQLDATVNQIPDKPSNGSQHMPSPHGTMIDALPPSPTPTKARSQQKHVGPPNQPRREPSNIVIACQQCRARKIKCDSARPHCTNCLRRSNPCAYDPVPKRRGPDKRPGTRQRSCKKKQIDSNLPDINRKDGTKRPLPRSIKSQNQPSGGIEPPNLPMPSEPQSDHMAAQVSTMGEGAAYLQSPTAPGNIQYLPPLGLEHPDMQLPVQGTTPYPSPTTPSPYALHNYYSQRSPTQQLAPKQGSSSSSESFHPKFPLPSSNVQNSLKNWWDNLFLSYPLQDIISDIKFLNDSESSDFSSIDLETLLERLTQPAARLTLQPSLIYMLLAHSNFLRSSVGTPYAENCRKRSSWLRDNAESSLIASWSSTPSTTPDTWIDASLASTAYLIALYESSSHEQHRPERLEKAIRFLDSVIDRLGLLKVDVGDPDVISFPSVGPPCVSVATSASLQDPASHTTFDSSPTCNCIPADSPVPPNPYENCQYILPWSNSWSLPERQQEQIRRICWASLDLVTKFSVAQVTFGAGLGPSRDPDAALVQGHLILGKAENYSLLFPGEAFSRDPPGFDSSLSLNQKESIWALYCRSMLLWHYATRISYSLGRGKKGGAPKENIAEYTQETWTEAQSIEDSLNAHICNLDTSLMFCCREYIFNTRMTVSQIFRSLHGLDNPIAPPPGPMFNRKQAESWLYYQDTTIKRVKLSLANMNDVPSDYVYGRPSIIPWLLNQLVICLLLWNSDQNLINALELAKSILGPVDVLTRLWPSSYLRHQAETIHHRIAEACRSTNIPPPDPPSSLITRQTATPT